jgi:hypothetical protein
MHDHPTPMHIRSCILDALIKGMEEGKQAPPVWISQAISEGIRNACAEHDAEQAARKAA